MYAGEIVEVNEVETVFSAPKHPYTQSLISSLPRLENRGEFQGIPGMAPSLYQLPNGCKFHPRCLKHTEHCTSEIPHPQILEDGNYVACHLHGTS